MLIEIQRTYSRRRCSVAALEPSPGRCKPSLSEIEVIYTDRDSDKLAIIVPAHLGKAPWALAQDLTGVANSLHV